MSLGEGVVPLHGKGLPKEDEAKTKYPDGWDAPLPYLRLVKQPR